MAEERQYDTVNSDDASVLRMLLHSIHGLSPVSTTEYVVIPVEEE